MSYFKKFTDFCLGVVIFVASLFLLRQYMTFKPKTAEQYFVGMGGNAVETGVVPGKVEQFLEKDHRMLIWLVVLMLFSLIVSILFKKLPYISFAVSIIPAVEVAYLFQKDMLFEQELLFIAGTAIHVIGNLVDALLQDREDGRHRLWLSSLLGSLVSSAVCFIPLLSHFITPNLSDIESFISDLTKLPIEKVEKFEKFIFTPLQDIYISGIVPEEAAFLLVLGGIFGVTFVICLLTKNIYFINSLLSFIPLGAVIHLVYTKKLTAVAFALMVLSVVSVVTNILLMVFENNLSREEQQALTKKEDEHIPESE